MNGNRIEQTTPATAANDGSASSAPPAPTTPWWKTAVARRVAIGILLAALGVTCKFIPNPLISAVCQAVVGAGHQAIGAPAPSIDLPDAG